MAVDEPVSSSNGRVALLCPWNYMWTRKSPNTNVATDSTAPTLALLGFGVVVTGAAVVVFSATWLWAAGVPGLAVLVAIVEETVDGVIVVGVVAAVVDIVVEGIVVCGCVGAGVVMAAGASVLSGPLLGGVASAGGVLSPSDIGPVPVGPWAFASAVESAAAAATVVPSSPCAMTTPERSIQTAHTRTSRSMDLLAVVIVAGDFRRGSGSARSEQYGTRGGTGSSRGAAGTSGARVGGERRLERSD